MFHTRAVDKVMVSIPSYLQFLLLSIRQLNISNVVTLFLFYLIKCTSTRTVDI